MENMNKPNNVGNSSENVINVGISFPEMFEKEAPDFLEDFLEEEGITDFAIIETRKTRKSIYGTIEFENRKYHFKIGDPESILTELKGFKVASEYPHENIISHTIKGNHGIYLQEFSGDLENKKNLLINSINDILLETEGDNVTRLLKKTEAILRGMGEVYKRSLTSEPIIFEGANDKFFYERIKDKGRVDQLYLEKKFKFVGGIDFDFDELLEYKISINNGTQSPKLKELIVKAKEDLSPQKKRYFVVSQGDPTETNLSVNGTFFDFETGGYNSLVQDLAIFSCYNYFGGHYVAPKYSSLDFYLEAEDVNRFIATVSARVDIDEQNKVLKTQAEFKPPSLKSTIFRQFIDYVVRPIEEGISQEDQELLVEQLKSAILLRIIGVKDILKFSEKDLVLFLGFIGHFCNNDHPNKLSDFLAKKFIKLTPEINYEK